MSPAKEATMVHAIIRSARRPSVAGAPPGLEGTGPLRVLEAGASTWLVVADAPLNRYGSAPIERGLRDLEWVGRRAAAHESIVEHFASPTRGRTVVPMKLFTLFSSDARAVDHVKRLGKKLDLIVDRIAGCEEWGVRVLFDEVRAAQVAAERERAGAKAPKTGKSFLVMKKKQHDAVRELTGRARDEADRVFEELSARATDAQRRAPVHAEIAGRVLLDAVFLVPQRTRARFRADVGRHGAALDHAGYRVVLTGPWPPYHFISATGASS